MPRTDSSVGGFRAGAGGVKAAGLSISFGDFQLDCERGVLRRAGQYVEVAPKPLALLIYLAQHRTRAVPKRELLEQLWPDVFVSETALSSALKDLRRAIGDDGARQQVIRTLRRRGYRFAARVRNREVAPTSVHGRDASGARSLPELPALVGRARELDWLIDRVVEVAGGRPRVALVVGEAGIGKTRLIEQLEREPACDDFEVITGRCQVEASLPYLPFVEALSQWLLQNDETLDRLLGGDLGIVRRLLQPDSDAAPSVLDAETSSGERRRAELFTAIYRVFEQLAQRRPLVLVIEDLHCADAASLDLLGHLVGAMSDARTTGPLPLLLVATLRPPTDDDRIARAVEELERESICDRLDLGGLDVDEVRELAECLGVASLPARGARQIAAATGGNPLFIRECIREGGQGRPRVRAARRGRGSRAAGSSLPRPTELRGALGSRIGSLRSRTRAVLTVAAMIGDRFGLLALGAACRMSAEAIAAAVSEAVDAGVLTGERRSFRFAHPLVREVLLDSMLPAEREEIHGDLADVLEDLYASATGEHALEIAHHLILAGSGIDQKRLLDYARRAADQAFAICAWRDAARFYDAATRATEVLPPAERAALHFRAGVAANRDTDAESCRRHLTNAAELFARIGDDSGRARVLMLLLRAQITSSGAEYGEPVDVGGLTELGMKLSDEQPAISALILETLSEACWTAGDAARAEAYAERALGMGRRIDDDAVCRQASMGLALARFSLMKVRDAIEGWRGELAHARRARDSWLASFAATRISLGLLHLGRLDEGIETAEEAERLARGAQNLMDLSLVLSQQACLHVARGNFEAVETTSRAALLAIQRSRYPWGGPLVVGARACADAHRGAWREAETSLAMLAAKGPIFDAPAPLIQLVVASYRELVAALRDPASVELPRLANLLKLACAAPSDIHLLAPLCALVETALRVGAPELTTGCERMLRLADDHGVVFTAGWVQSIPRLLAGCAAATGRVDEAELGYERAIATSRAAPARIELALSLVGRAGLLAGRDAPRAAADLAEAASIASELALRPLAKEAQRLVESLAV